MAISFRKVEQRLKRQETPFIFRRRVLLLYDVPNPKMNHTIHDKLVEEEIYPNLDKDVRIAQKRHAAV